MAGRCKQLARLEQSVVCCRWNGSRLTSDGDEVVRKSTTDASIGPLVELSGVVRPFWIQGRCQLSAPSIRSSQGSEVGGPGPEVRGLLLAVPSLYLSMMRSGSNQLHLLWGSGIDAATAPLFKVHVCHHLLLLAKLLVISSLLPES